MQSDAVISPMQLLVNPDFTLTFFYDPAPSIDIDDLIIEISNYLYGAKGL